MDNYIHLSLSERITLETGLSSGKSLNVIARDMGRSRSTLAREIKTNRTAVYKGSFGRGANNCAHFMSCKLKNVCERCFRPNTFCTLCGKCNELCQSYTPAQCEKLVGTPFCCNSCPKHGNCALKRYRYEAAAADRKAASRLSELRTGIVLSQSELENLDQLVSPLIRKGQSIHHIYVHHADEMPCSERTLYSLLDSGCLKARNLDLPRKARRQLPRKRKEHKVDRLCRQGRSYADYHDYLELHPDCAATLMDSVLGCTGSNKVLLTLFWPQAQFLLIRLRDRNSARSVSDCFDELARTLGPVRFNKLFPFILTDNGSEFSNPAALEQNGACRIFYCDPLQSNQKSPIERVHQFIREVLPKGSSFDLLEQPDFDLLASHINSYSRPSLVDRTPFDVFELLYGTQTLELLRIQRIPHDLVTLKPVLLKKT